MNKDIFRTQQILMNGREAENHMLDRKVTLFGFGEIFVRNEHSKLLDFEAHLIIHPK